MTAGLQDTDTNGSLIGQAGLGRYTSPILGGEPAADPTRLERHSFVYLWAPGIPKGHPERILARVESTTTDIILARDLASGCRGKYEVGTAYPAGLRWTFALAGPPECSAREGNVEFLDREQMAREERRQFLLGEVGQLQVFHLEGGSSVAGIVTKIVYEDDRPEWLLVSSPADSIKQYEAPVQVSKIAHIMRVARD